MNWEEYSIEKLCVKVTDGAHFSPQEFPGGYPMASSKDMSENDFDLSNVKTISEQDYLKLVSADCKPLVGDVLLIKDGNSYLKSIFQVKEERELVVLSSIAMLRPKQAIIYPLFFQYALRNPVAKKQMENFVSGAAIPRIVLKDFKQMKVSIPSLPVQQKIASILSAYDDLIENNFKRIRLLEEAAQHLYREWFVKFRFPGWEEVKMVDGLPEGWERKAFEQVLNFKTGKLDSNASVINGSYPFFTCSQEIFKTNTFSFDTEAVLLGGNNASGIYPLKYFKGKFDAYQRTYIIKPKDSSLSHKYVYLVLNDLLDYLKNISTGAATKFLTLRILNQLEIVVPSDFVNLKFENIIDKIFSQKQLLSIQNQKLKTARDLLLPRLMSGSIEV